MKSLTFEPISHAQLPDQVTRQLTRLIIEGRLAPGERLVERELGARLGVSRTPIRESLGELRRRGLVRFSGPRGLFVSPLDEEEIVGVYRAIAALERAALLHMPEVAPAMMALLRKARCRFEAAGGDISRLTTADAEWHETLIRFARNEALADALQPLRSDAARYEHAFFGMAANFERSNRDHAEIESMLAFGDLPAAAKALEAHWLDSIDRMRAAIAEARPPRSDRGAL